MISKHLQKRADQIRDIISIYDVLSDFGYRVDPTSKDREQQFSCDLHGDGKDSKPSSRVYPSSNSYYCWACGRTRDSISLVREKLGLNWIEAVKYLEKEYSLPKVPWEQEESVENNEESINQDVEDLVKRIERKLLLMTQEKEIEAQRLALFWENFDGLKFMNASKEKLFEFYSKISEFS